MVGGRCARAWAQSASNCSSPYPACLRKVAASIDCIAAHSPRSLERSVLIVREKLASGRGTKTSGNGNNRYRNISMTENGTSGMA